MNKFLSVILTVCLMCISCNISEPKGTEVKLEEAMPVVMDEVEIVEVKEIEVIEEVEEVEPVEETESEPEQDKSYLGNFKITYYCDCTSCSDDWGDLTATGVRAKEGRTIAVDPNVISYGTKVLINGKEYVAEDCGGAIKGNRIDIFIDSHEQARKAGVDYFDVYIVS